MHAAPDVPPWPQDAVEVGFVTGAWGVKGWIRVQPHAAEPQALFSSRRWFVRPPGDARQAPAPRPVGANAALSALPTCLRIAQAREHGDGVVAQVHDVDDRAAAEALKGARIFVSRQSFPTADPDEYYWVDLIGLAVVNRQGETLGEVAGLVETGPQSALRVVAAPGNGQDRDGQRDAAAERLIPFVAAYVDAVDLAARRIVVDWGLDY
jgi:16S rRNA processing protein RimM